MNDFIRDNMWSINVSLLHSKGLARDNVLTQRYFTVYKNYKILEKYLLNVLNLAQYDNMFTESNLKFIPVTKNDMDYYQCMSTMGLKYIFFRNDLYIENLDLDDIEKMAKLSNQELANPDNELFKFIENTYKIVINSNVNTNINQMYCYGPDINRFWFDSREIVFGFRYDEFVDDYVGDKEWEDNYFKQMEFLNNLFIKMSSEFSDILGVKVNLIHYNEFTVKNHITK